MDQVKQRSHSTHAATTAEAGVLKCKDEHWHRFLFNSCSFEIQRCISQIVKAHQRHGVIAQKVLTAKATKTNAKVLRLAKIDLQGTHLKDFDFHIGKAIEKVRELISTLEEIDTDSKDPLDDAIAAFKDKQEYLTDFVRNKKNPRVENPIKIIAIPTTSGTSSELTCWATIWDKEKNNKLSLAHKSLYAEKTIIDPSIMVDKPLGLTISTGFDALSHSMESIWNINANPISASHAIQASKLVLENLPLLTKDLRNVVLRSNIALACVWLCSPATI